MRARSVLVVGGWRVLLFAGGGGAGGGGRGADDVRVAGVDDRQCAHPEEASARGAELEVHAAVVVDAHLRQHRVVLHHRSPIQYSAQLHTRLSGSE